MWSPAEYQMTIPPSGCIFYKFIKVDESWPYFSKSHITVMYLYYSYNVQLILTFCYSARYPLKLWSFCSDIQWRKSYFFQWISSCMSWSIFSICQNLLLKLNFVIHWIYCLSKIWIACKFNKFSFLQFRKVCVNP